MTTSKKRSQSKPPHEREISVRTVRRSPPDLRKFGRALLALAQAEAEAQAQDEHTKKAKASEEEDGRHG